MSQRTVKVTADVIRILRNINILWQVVNNDPDHTIEALGGEFHRLVGEFLEGKHIEQATNFYLISKARVLAQSKE